MSSSLPVPAPHASLVAGSTVAPPARTPTPPRVEPAPAVTPHRDRADLEALLRQAASARYPGRDVAVSLSRDEASDRVVVRVQDRVTGEIIHQYPPEELLRFFAAARRDGEPLIDVLG